MKNVNHPKSVMTIVKRVFSKSTALFSRDKPIHATFKFIVFAAYLYITAMSSLAVKITTSTTPQSSPNEVTFSQLSSTIKAFCASQGIEIATGMTLIIDEDIVFSSNAKIAFNNNGHSYECGILVNKAAILILEATVKGDIWVTPTSSLRRSWEGIAVLGNPNEDHFSVDPDPSTLLDKSAYYGTLNTAHGIVKLGPDSRIEMAKSGIHSFDGGIVEAFEVMTDNSPLGAPPLFLNNFDALVIENSKQVAASGPAVSATRLNNVRFEFDDDAGLAFSGPSVGYSNAASFSLVKIIGSKGIYFGGCDFVNTDGFIHSSHSNFDEYDRGIGVLLLEKNVHDDNVGESSVIISEAGDVFYTPGAGDPGDATCTYVKILGHETDVESFVDPRTGTTISRHRAYGCKFELLSQGVSTRPNYMDAEFAEQAAIAYATFKDNYIQIALDVFQVDIHRCDLEIDDVVLDFYFNSPSFSGGDLKQIDLNKSGEVLVYDNVIKASASVFGARGESIGISNVGSNPKNSAKKILVRYNFIDGDISSNNDATHGVKASGKLSNFEWSCNTFENNDIDVSYSGSIGPPSNPRSKKPANNNYSGATFAIENLTTTPVTYYYDPSGSSPSPVNNPTLVDVKQSTHMGEVECEIKCSELDDLRNDLHDPLSVEELILGKLQVFPNPASESISLNANLAMDLTNATITIYSSTGLLQKQVIYYSNESIDVSHLTAGLYIVKVDKDGVVYSNRFIKQ